MIIKCISVKEPFASWIREGLKDIETRTWKTNYRGKLLIQASQVPKTEFSGKAIAICDLIDCRPMTKEDERRSFCPCYEGTYAWELKNIIPIKPVPVKGQLSIFDVEIN